MVLHNVSEIHPRCLVELCLLNDCWLSHFLCRNVWFYVFLAGIWWFGVVSYCNKHLSFFVVYWAIRLFHCIYVYLMLEYICKECFW